MMPDVRVVLRQAKSKSIFNELARYLHVQLPRVSGKSPLAQATHSKKWSWLKAWAMRVAQRRGVRRATVALARRIAVILHRMWIDGTDFRFSNSAAKAA